MEYFSMIFHFKNGCKNEFKYNNEKSCSWSRRVSHKIDFKAVWLRNGHAASVGVRNSFNFVYIKIIIFRISIDKIFTRILRVSYCWGIWSYRPDTCNQNTYSLVKVEWSINNLYEFNWTFWVLRKVILTCLVAEFHNWRVLAKAFFSSSRILCPCT